MFEKFVSFAIFAGIAWIATAVIGFTLVACGDSAKIGQFGDFFGAFNCLLSSLTVAGAIVAIMAQQNESKDARNDAIYSRIHQQETLRIQEQSARLQALGALLASKTAEFDMSVRRKSEVEQELRDLSNTVPQSQRVNERKKDLENRNQMIFKGLKEKSGKMIVLQKEITELMESMKLRAIASASETPHPPASAPAAVPPSV